MFGCYICFSGLENSKTHISKVDLTEQTSNELEAGNVDNVPESAGSNHPAGSDLEEMLRDDSADDMPLCRICQEKMGIKGKDKLISPCGCSGSSKFIHIRCLQKWTRTKGSNICEICNKQYEQKYLKLPRLTTSEENTLVSALIILVLLSGVTGVGVYLLVAHIHETAGNITGDIWISLSLLTSGGMGLALFMPWFSMFIWRICVNSKRRRELPIYINV
ncbi:E3 ubiquitin-protein ligase MARCH8-like [Anneissia japonica]|uniref:E3 ubiquitin-protein ligase MARCH8-like n=1 Tax=Anneissia japonica TaxID=1529436 RepID=UPI001425AE5B|nr:E3 ubiquitin-protein ligase MARCH8-like [Anneissia japonica]